MPSGRFGAISAGRKQGFISGLNSISWIAVMVPKDHFILIPQKLGMHLATGQGVGGQGTEVAGG